MKEKTRISLKNKDAVGAFWRAEFAEWDRENADNVLAFLRKHSAPESLIKYVMTYFQFKGHCVGECLRELAKKAGRPIPPWGMTGDGLPMGELPSISEFVLFDPKTGEEFDSVNACM